MSKVIAAPIATVAGVSFFVLLIVLYFSARKLNSYERKSLFHIFKIQL
jgi:hypothetical protein